MGGQSHTAGPEAIYARHLEEMRARHKLTPYRVGLAEGAAFAEISANWSIKAKSTREFSGRPEARSCPYANAHSVRAWREGFARKTTPAELRAAIAKATGESA